jgi:Glycosyl hydrolases family 2, sugar binding domain/Glycosyl hydrolases family 2, TIM barrel domain/Glycosyl hydrolases family 2
MKKCPLVYALGLLVVAVPYLAADWQPAKGPLATQWAKDVKPDKVLPEYPRPQMVRPDWQNLNGVWQFAEAKEGDEPPTGKKLDQEILVPFCAESALSGVMKHSDRLWYRRTFSVKKEWADKRLLLHFGAVNWDATVWVNGKKLGNHQGGYDGFSFDITDALKKDGEQELIVGVWNPVDKGTQPRGKQVLKPGGIFYTPCTGIWQTVWLEPVPARSIGALAIAPKLKDDVVLLAKFAVQVRGEPKGLRARWEVLQNGKALIAWDSSLDGGTDNLIPNPKLWSPESPFLYDVRVSLLDGAKVIDTATSYFAVRDMTLGKDDKGVTRMLLNGKPYFQVGPLDQGFWPDGIYTAPTDEALKYDIEITKKLGFNMIRKHVKVEPERWYYWCDKLGILVWQDMPSGDKSIGPNQPDIKRTEKSAEIYERELKAMIDGRGNHPCIVMWVPFNEGWGQFDTGRIVESVKKQDPSRLVDCASGWADRAGIGDVHDIHDYARVPGSAQPEDKRAAVLGEFGGLGLGIDGHSWTDKHWGYQELNSKTELTRKYEQLLKRVYDLRDKPGMSAAVYTQTTDVETESNGLLTYDRAIIKVDADRIAAVNKGDFSKVPTFKVTELVPTSKKDGLTWKYTFEKPDKDWFKPDFKVDDWKEGVGGFGTKGTPGAIVRTEWNSDDIWLRREFTLPEGKHDDLQLLLHHDDDVEVYLNGVLAAKLKGWKTDYEETPISAEAKAALKPGKNVFAVHCHQFKGGQYIDVGLVNVKEEKPAPK